MKKRTERRKGAEEVTESRGVNKVKRKREQRFLAAGSRVAGFSGALNDPAISIALNTLPRHLH